MEFDYSEEQLALQDTLQKFIARDYDFDTRRALASSPAGYSPQAWQQYAELGLLALPFPEALGGLDGNGVDTMLVMEQFGFGLLLEPYLSTVVVCGSLLRDNASAELQREWLPKIAAGEALFSLAAYEAASRYELSRVATRATPSGEGWTLTGRKAVVLDAPSADQFLVSARTSGEVADGGGISLFRVPRNVRGLSVSEYATQWGARAADLSLDGVVVAGDSLIGTPGAGFEPLERAVDRGCAALCAEAVGIMGALNQATLNHLKTRKQFGVAIGTFQALKHHMADSLIAAEQARSMAIIAAVHADSAEAAVRRRHVAAAKAYIGQAGRLVGQQSVQMHGGMGVVDELIVSHYFKRLTMIDLIFGDADYQLARFSDTLHGARQVP